MHYINSSSSRLRTKRHALGRSFDRTSVMTGHRQLIVYAQKEDYCGNGRPDHAVQRFTGSFMRLLPPLGNAADSQVGL